jgi:integrase
MATEKLTHTEIKKAGSREKTYRLFDGGGLYLEINPHGRKYWRLKYRYGEKEKRLALGVYPDVTLKEARVKRLEARKQLDAGLDPSVEKKKQQTRIIAEEKNTFELIAREWFKKEKPGRAKTHTKTQMYRLERNIFPQIGNTAITTLTPPMMLSMLRSIENKGAYETAQRVKIICSQVFRYAIACGIVDSDPCRDLKDALTPPKEKHHPAIIEPDGVGRLLYNIDAYDGHFVTKCALQLAPLFFVRPGELRQARWADFDFDKREWRFVLSKTHIPHIVPLASQAIAILSELAKLNGNGTYLFPSVRGPANPMSNNTINAALRNMGYDKNTMTCHGFRAMARTLLDEELHEENDLIEHQLGHSVRDPIGRAYNRTTHLKQRKGMMQRWADYLGALKHKAANSTGKQRAWIVRLCICLIVK